MHVTYRYFIIVMILNSKIWIGATYRYSFTVLRVITVKFIIVQLIEMQL